MTLEEFEEIVNQIVAELPAEFKAQMENVDIVVEGYPTQQELNEIMAHPGTTLFGLYRGVPKTKRGSNYSGVLPDKITIYAGPILNMTYTIEEAKKQIKKTVLHEIGHHFGMSEEAIRKAQG